jgi:hypothetical protein
LTSQEGRRVGDELYDWKTAAARDAQAAVDELDAWIGSTITYLQRRLDYAELLVTASGNTTFVVTFDASALEALDDANITADVTAAIQALKAGDPAAVAAILARYHVTSLDLPDGFTDPMFAQAFALAANPTEVANLLLGLNADPNLDQDWYAGFLTTLASTISTGARAMNATDLRHFTIAWTEVTNTQEHYTTGALTGLPQTTNVARVQALSLLIGRGDWPPSFLTNMVSAL